MNSSDVTEIEIRNTEGEVIAIIALTQEMYDEVVQIAVGRYLQEAIYEMLGRSKP